MELIAPGRIFVCVKFVFGQWEGGLEAPFALPVTQNGKALWSTADFSLFICFATAEHRSEDNVGMKGGKDNGDVLTGFQRDLGWCRLEQLIPPPNQLKTALGKDQRGFCTQNLCLPHLRRLFKDDDARENKQDPGNQVYI